ncbi:hypothetical protein BKK51_11485 [Rodentibacter trehalosifermentans]|uniref:Uncharacterized protein n=1 Tax=Rodentibacter trehalosifermentans TaxID=1908263 RepID=A0A1V3IMR7_9PAST|nr:hypothetical protein [Rodentibacter trehalosifermentans]OOF43456.1 hypothetical protein BKK51_11485 [Rodentibacter trehalosifermentans]
MGLRQRIKNTIKLANLKHAAPFTVSALKRKTKNATAGNSKTIGTIHRFDVAARGFFKRRSVFKDKLFSCAVSRYFILKFGALFFCLGQFFLSRFVSISEYFDLILEQGNPLTQNSIAFHTGEQVKSGFGGSEDSGNIHNEPLNEKDGSDCKKK